jgi:hypothetical protein
MYTSHRSTKNGPHRCKACGTVDSAGFVPMFPREVMKGLGFSLKKTQWGRKTKQRNKVE